MQKQRINFLSHSLNKYEVPLMWQRLFQLLRRELKVWGLCGSIVGKAAACSVGSPSEHWLMSQLLHFQTSFAANVLGKVEEYGSPPTTGRHGRSFTLASVWSSTDYFTHMGSEPVYGRFFCLHLSLTL